MENKILKQIINQIKKYNLMESFSNAEEFKKWVSSLNSTQVNNFLSLDIELEEIKDLKHLLINDDLLKCKDYKQKVDAISTIKNGDGCWHLFSEICKPNFLKSKNFYKDIELLSKADTARHGLWILGNKNFINSPYHDEDLKLLIETHDINKENPKDFVVSDAIATVASDIDSIRSPYHQADMKLIATSGSDCLQMSHSYPEHSLNNLAVDKVSLADKYHLENMQILATNPLASEFLYEIMTDSYFVKGKNYRKEVEALLKAKSKITARALYYYIVNPDRKYLSDMNFFNDYEYNSQDVHISDRNSISGSHDPDYLKNLNKINEMDDKFILYYVSLLMNPEFINSPYKKFDMEFLEHIDDKKIFMDLYILMKDNDSLNGSYHKKDVVRISQATIEDVRKLLLKKACNKYSLASPNHDYDMDFISKLNLNSIDEKIFEEMYYYLFRKVGIEDIKHREKLEKLLQGILVERNSSVSDYLDTLENQLDNCKSDKEIIETKIINENKHKGKILSLFKKKTK